MASALRAIATKGSSAASSLALTGRSNELGAVVGVNTVIAIVETAIPDMPRTLANPIRLGFAEQRIAHAAPALGQHSEDILREAGLSAAEIATLKASGATQ